MDLAPVIIFTYKRLDHLKQVFQALAKNDLYKQSKVFVFCDGPKNETDSTGVLETRNWLKYEKLNSKIELIFKDENQGLANSVIAGVSQVLSDYDSAIVLEDDIVVSAGFLNYMNNALHHFESFAQIGSISGYSFPSGVFRIPGSYKDRVYFSYRPSSWGWATWSDRWNKVDWSNQNFDTFLKAEIRQKEFNRGGRDLIRMLNSQFKGKIDSWAIRWAFHHYRHNLLAVYPVKSLVNNIGIDDSATNTRSRLFKHLYANRIDDSLLIDEFPSEILLNEEILSNFKRIYNRSSKFIATWKYWLNSMNRVNSSNNL